MTQVNSFADKIREIFHPVIHPRRLALVQLTIAAVVLLGLAACCDPARGQEVARVEVTRPAVVVVERTPEGGIRLVIEYRPSPSGPTPDPTPAPGVREASEVVASALAAIDPTDRKPFRLAAIESTGWLLANAWVKPGELGGVLATRVVAQAGATTAPAALVLANDLDAAPDKAARLAAIRDALEGDQSR